MGGRRRRMQRARGGRVVGVVIRHHLLQMAVVEHRAGLDRGPAIGLQPLAAIGEDPHGGFDEEMRPLLGGGAVPILGVMQDLQKLCPHEPAGGRGRREEQRPRAIVEGDGLDHLGHGAAQHLARQRQAGALRRLGDAVGHAAHIEVAAAAAADLVEDRAELELRQRIALPQQMAVGGDEDAGQLRIAAQLVAGGLDLPRQGPADGDPAERQILRRGHQGRPGNAPVAGLHIGHAPDGGGHAELPAGDALGHEEDRLDLLGLGVMDEAGPAAADAGVGGQGHGQGEIAGDGGIDGRAAAREHIAGDQRRPRLIRGHGAGEALTLPLPISMGPMPELLPPQPGMPERARARRRSCGRETKNLALWANRSKDDMRKRCFSLLAAASAPLDAPPAGWAAGQAPSSIRDGEGETSIRAQATPLFPAPRPRVRTRGRKTS